MNIELSYHQAMVAKGIECAIEAGPQSIFQTYTLMQTKWVNWPWWNVLEKGYLQEGGNFSTFYLEHIDLDNDQSNQ